MNGCIFLLALLMLHSANVVGWSCWNATDQFRLIKSLIFFCSRLIFTLIFRKSILSFFDMAPVYLSSSLH